MYEKGSFLQLPFSPFHFIEGVSLPK